MDLVAVFAVFALFVFMLTLQCFSVATVFSVNKDLYIRPNSNIFSFVFYHKHDVKSYVKRR